MDKEQQVLGSLDLDYHVFCTSLCVLLTLPTFEDFRTKFIQYEVDLVHTTQQEDDNPVMMTQVPSRPQSTGLRVNTTPAERGLLPTPAQVLRNIEITTYFLCNRRRHINTNYWFNPQNKNKA